MTRPAEATAVHTRILRCALEVEESRAWWRCAAIGSSASASGGAGAVSDTAPAPTADRDAAADAGAADATLGADAGLAARATNASIAERAFREYWFGARSLPRVELLVANLRARFDAFPPSLAVLHAWDGMDPDTRRLVCHWHLQLADPLYRAFTASYLSARRQSRPDVTRDHVTAWVGTQDPEGRWSLSTRVQFASKLLSAAYAAGLVAQTRDPRPLRLPRVPDDALAYALHLLRGVSFAGTLLDNPYLSSVGLDGPTLDARLRALRCVTLRRQGDLVELEWAHPTLLHWAAATVAPSLASTLPVAPAPPEAP